MNPATVNDNDAEAALLDAVRSARDANTPLRLRGSGSKDFYGPACSTDNELDLRVHRGIVAYEPTELAVTVRAGTSLADLQAALIAEGQHLPFEPPSFGDGATVGGMLAAGLSGPRRPWGGAVRDSVLGVRIINGRGEALGFGGQVMKNVAGYDLSRLMAGSMGTLGIILQTSFKVLPRPAQTATRVFEANPTDALKQMRRWARASLPISASCYHDGQLSIRLAGGEQAVQAAQQQLGGDAGDNALWQQLRDQQTEFFHGDQPLWRLSLPPATPWLESLPGDQLLEWSGALRWLRSDASASTIREAAQQASGHATLFRNTDSLPSASPFTPLSPPLLQFHQQLKQALDPDGLFNPGRLYSDF